MSVKNYLLKIEKCKQSLKIGMKFAPHENNPRFLYKLVSGYYLF